MNFWKEKAYGLLGLSTDRGSGSDVTDTAGPNSVANMGMETEMSEPWKVRVFGEADQLDERIRKLDQFVHSYNLISAVPHPERDRLKRQLVYMRLYRRVLRERIENDFK